MDDAPRAIRGGVPIFIPSMLRDFLVLLRGVGADAGGCAIGCGDFVVGVVMLSPMLDSGAPSFASGVSDEPPPALLDGIGMVDELPQPLYRYRHTARCKASRPIRCLLADSATQAPPSMRSTQS